MRTHLTETISSARTKLAIVKSFGSRLERAIIQAGKSKKALASHLGIPQSSISRWVNGSTPRADTISTIANFLGCDFDWLARGQGNPSQVVSSGTGSQSIYGAALRVAEVTRRVHGESLAHADISKDSASILRDESPLLRDPKEPSLMERMARIETAQSDIRDSLEEIRRSLNALTDLMAAPRSYPNPTLTHLSDEEV